MSTAVAPETQDLGVKDAPNSPVAPPLAVTEKAAEEVKRVIVDMQARSIEAVALYRGPGW